MSSKNKRRARPAPVSEAKLALPCLDVNATYTVYWPSGMKSLTLGGHLSSAWDWYCNRAARIVGPDGELVFGLAVPSAV